MIALAIGCSQEEGPENFNLSQLERLLTGDSIKTWILTERISGTDLQECEKDNALIFELDSLKVRLETGSILCPGEIDSLIYQGEWAIIDGPLMDSLVFIISTDTTKRSIDLISSQTLGLTFLDNGQIITESFTYRK